MSELTVLLKSYLFQAGTQGRKQSEIFHRLKYLPREDVLSELNALWAEEKVQRFTLKHPVRAGAQAVIVWRATDNFNV